MALVLLSACALQQTPDHTAQTGLVQSLLDAECRAQLNQRQEWQIMAALAGAEKKARWERQVCTCVSSEAAAKLSAAEMVAVLNPATRQQTLSVLAAETVSACLQKMVVKNIPTH
ncbi:MAG: hypothetical protein Q4G42_04400 [Neisseria sp.]|nr:hypothetical protein [Neisseria sp.]